MSYSPLVLIRTLAQYVCVSVIMVVLGLPLAIATLILPARYRYTSPAYFKLFHIFYRAIVWCTWVPVTVIGSPEVFKQAPAVVVANHQSSLDVPLLGAYLEGTPHVWLALAQFARHPFLGVFVRRLGFGVDGSDHAGSATSMKRAVSYARTYPGHVVLFPEGGRYNDGEVHPFMRGFALIQRMSDRAVIPVYMPYNGRVYPPGSFLVHIHPLVIRVGEPMTRQPEEDDAAFIARVHHWFEEQQRLTHPETRR